jgi:hypothetical protein
LVVSFAGGFGAGAAAEALDSRIHGRSGISSITGVPPLAVIPMLHNRESSALEIRRRVLIAGTVLLVIISMLLAVHFLLMPLDVLYFRALRVVG